MDSLHPDIVAKIEKCNKEGFLDITQIPKDSVVKVWTMNTQYNIIVTDPSKREIIISGNTKYCPQPTPAVLVGSNFGGSMLKLYSIFKDGYIEFVITSSNKLVVTSSVQRVILQTPDNNSIELFQVPSLN